MKTFLYDYYYDGARWSLSISAHSKEDADDILNSLPLANYAGELQFIIPAVGTKWLANFIVWWKNLMSKNK